MFDMQARRQARARFERADSIIENWDDQYRAHWKTKALPIEPTKDDLAISETAAIEVSCEWLASVLSHAEYVGADRIIEIFRPLMAAWDDEATQDLIRGASPAFAELIQDAFDRL